MKKITELPMIAQLGIFLGIAAVLVAGGEYFYLLDMAKANSDKEGKLKTLKLDNEAVKPFEGKLKQIKVENEQLSRQLTNLRTIVPEEKEADSFMRMMQEAGVTSNVDIRKFTAKPPVNREFYVEMPFDLQIEGNYNGMVQFFEKMGKLPRIVNVSNLVMAAPSGPPAAGKTVQATCTATTFYGRAQAQAARPAGRK